MEDYGAGMSSSQQLRIMHYQGRAYYVDVWPGHPYYRTIGITQWHETPSPFPYAGIHSPRNDTYSDWWRI